MSEEDPKAENIMKNVYIGTEATKCDGSIYGYSNFMHIITSKAKKDDKGTMDFWSMISNEYNYNFEVDYAFQHRYRSRSISTFFQKELFFSCVTCVVGLLIYVDFLDNFRGKDVYFVKAKNYTEENRLW